MRKKSFLLLMLAMTSIAGFAQRTVFEVKGQVTDNKGKGIVGVVVNDGVHFTTTDASGQWALTTDTTYSKFISISTPAAYKLPQERGLARFYKPIAEAVASTSNKFVLRARKKVADKFTYLAISDPQVLNEDEMNRWRNETVKDLRSVADSLKKSREVIAMTLGDLVFDNMPLFPEYEQSCQTLGVTTFQTIGNHDFDKQYQDLHNMRQGALAYAEHFFNKYFGPTDYSFNIGKIHVITMKNIDYVGGKKYIEHVTDAQLAWLEKDLSYVPKGSVVFVNMHAAGWNKYNNEGNFRGAQAVVELLKDYDVHFFCGHTHFFQNIVVNDRFFQHNIGAACGSWWAGDLSVCGAPNGYLVVDVDGTNVRWHYKPTKGSFSDQFRTYLPGQFRTQVGMVVANVWDFDPQCKIEYAEDGVQKGSMEQFVDIDDAYIYQQNRIGKKVPSDRKTGHLFRFKPTKGTKKIAITFTNRFGETYTREYQL